MSVLLLFACVIALISAVVSLMTLLGVRRLGRDLLEQQRILRAEAFELASMAKRAMEAASYDAARAEDFLEIAQAASASMEKTSRVARRVITFPVVRAKALTVGIRTAKRVFFGRAGGSQ
ncbi:MAG: hypothetical protein HKL81_04615 [Acidimicrobiaceae bacterium]|nr:hypothetical protein [Acidimicrobiaceae bacterium]